LKVNRCSVGKMSSTYSGSKNETSRKLAWSKRLPGTSWFLAWLIRLRRWRRHVPLVRRLPINGFHRLYTPLILSHVFVTLPLRQRFFWAWYLLKILSRRLDSTEEYKDT
jgi:hypothetical protein